MTAHGIPRDSRNRRIATKLVCTPPCGGGYGPNCRTLMLDQTPYPAPYPGLLRYSRESRSNTPCLSSFYDLIFLDGRNIADRPNHSLIVRIYHAGSDPAALHADSRQQP